MNKTKKVQLWSGIGSKILKIDICPFKKLKLKMKSKVVGYWLIDCDD